MTDIYFHIKIVFTDFTFKLIRNVSSMEASLLFCTCVVIGCICCARMCICCAHMCICCARMCVCCARVYVLYMHWGWTTQATVCLWLSEDTGGCFPLPPCLRKYLCLHNHLSGSINFQPPVSASHLAVGTLHLQMSATVFTFYAGSWGSNSGSHSCPVWQVNRI